MSRETAISADDKKWRAECDAGTLAEAAAIRSDGKRMAAAKKAAKALAPKREEQAKQARAEASQMKRLASSRKQKKVKK